MTVRTRIIHGICGVAALLAAVAALAGQAPPAPAVGDVYVYNLMNGYNGELRGQYPYEVTHAGPAGVTYAVTPTRPAA